MAIGGRRGKRPKLQLQPKLQRIRLRFVEGAEAEAIALSFSAPSLCRHRCHPLFAIVRRWRKHAPEWPFLAALVAFMTRLYRRDGRQGAQGIAQESIAGVLAMVSDGFEYFSIAEANSALKASFSLSVFATE